MMALLRWPSRYSHLCKARVNSSPGAGRPNACRPPQHVDTPAAGGNVVVITGIGLSGATQVLFGMKAATGLR